MDTFAEAMYYMSTGIVVGIFAAVIWLEMDR